MPKATPTIIAIVALVLSLIGIVWTAAEKWGDIQARVRHLEDTQNYLHGDIHVPGGK